ncbi:MAG: bifunctional ornithine acetyltransferase/N-acetylglutamate synthase [Cellvibrionales bacterium TMED49]|nr:bifunctional ornithine acetyltransferase/N-acetylglutamate synthase [Porticoccaceae bacterium]OUU38860.1 MAG: bifunctional ornithine acetyltransferase/N-acetylglutamate synthase [Cellvibrionales bacterium TMED49]
MKVDDKVIKLPHLKSISGFELGTVSAGVKEFGRPDFVMMRLTKGSGIAAIFTRNAFCAAPVSVAKKSLYSNHPTQYLIVNTGNANAGTGSRGIEDAEAVCAEVAKCMGVPIESVLPFSTGVIGEYLPLTNLLLAVPMVAANLSEKGWYSAAQGIMTTDTRPKGASVQQIIPSVNLGKDAICEDALKASQITITGIAKGSGMIRPDMATLLGFIATDAKVESKLLDRALRLVAEKSFNRITVDGDTSTNDSLVLVATGHSNVVVDEVNFYDFVHCLEMLCVTLAKECIRDGEGAKKFVTIEIIGALTEGEARSVAYTVAESPLVKTAIGASDPNWGRILAAIGRANINELDINKVSIAINGEDIVRFGTRAATYSEEIGVCLMREDDVQIRIDLGRGGCAETVWTTDLGHEYVRINAEYRT